MTLLERVMLRLQREMEHDGKHRQFQQVIALVDELAAGPFGDWQQRSVRAALKG